MFVPESINTCLTVSSKGKLKPAESSAWEPLLWVLQNCISNERTENYAERVDNMLKATFYQVTITVMSLRKHFLHSHLDFFSTKSLRCQR